MRRVPLIPTFVITVILFLSGSLITTPTLHADSIRSESSARVVSKKEQRKRFRRVMKRRVKRGGMKLLPAGQSAVRSKRRGKNRLAFIPSGRAVSGEPPLLVDISSDPANIFWQSGHVDAIANGGATPDQCNTFWGGNSDGESAGFGACTMAEGLGRALELAASGGASLCYMKSFPSQENLQSGGLSLVSGVLPDDDVTQIFSPGVEPRVIRVDVTNLPAFGDEVEQDHSIFIRVSPKSGESFYKAELWFCDGTGSSAAVSGTDVIEIENSGRITTRNENTGPGGEAFYSQFEGFLRPAKGGALQYDKDRPRTAEAGFSFFSDSFKVEMALSGRQVDVKTRSGGEAAPFLNSAIMRFSGDSPEEVRFRDGAFSSIFNGGSDAITGTAEWRDTYYAAAPESPLVSKVQSREEMDTDPFFQSGPDTNFDFSSYSCGVTPDIHVSLDFSNQTFLASVADCQPDTLRELNFCFGNPVINLAQQEFPNSCSGGI